MMNQQWIEIEGRQEEWRSFEKKKDAMRHVGLHHHA